MAEPSQSRMTRIGRLGTKLLVNAATQTRFGWYVLTVLLGYSVGATVGDYAGAALAALSAMPFVPAYVSVVTTLSRCPLYYAGAAVATLSALLLAPCRLKLATLSVLQ